MSMVLAETTLATMLSNCSAFRTYVGAADAAAALLKIYRGALPSPGADESDDGTRSQVGLSTLYPCAQIWTVNYAQKSNSTTGGMSTYLPSGTLACSLAHFDTLGSSSQTLYSEEMAAWDAIIPQLWDQTGAGGLAILSINANEIKHSAYQSRAEQALEDQDSEFRTRDISEMILEIEWGDEAGVS